MSFLIGFHIGELAVINENAYNGIPFHVGEKVTIDEYITDSVNYHYWVRTEDGQRLKVKKKELNKVNKDDYIMSLIKGETVLHLPTGKGVKIVKLDYIHAQAEVDHLDGSMSVVDLMTLRKLDEESVSVRDNEKQEGKFTSIGLEIGSFTDVKNKQYGSSVDATQKMMEALMERYAYDDENYLMPKSLLQHILLQVRMMDKINRVFNNPSGKGDSESPYRDLGGYSLIGIEMTERKRDVKQ